MRRAVGGGVRALMIDGGVENGGVLVWDGSAECVCWYGVWVRDLLFPYDTRRLFLWRCVEQHRHVMPQQPDKYLTQRISTTYTEEIGTYHDERDGEQHPVLLLVSTCTGEGTTGRTLIEGSRYNESLSWGDQLLRTTTCKGLTRWPSCTDGLWWRDEMKK